MDRNQGCYHTEQGSLLQKKVHFQNGKFICAEKKSTCTKILLAAIVLLIYPSSSRYSSVYSLILLAIHEHSETTILKYFFFRLSGFSDNNNYTIANPFHMICPDVDLL